LFTEEGNERITKQSVKKYKNGEFGHITSRFSNLIVFCRYVRGVTEAYLTIICAGLQKNGG